MSEHSFAAAILQKDLKDRENQLQEYEDYLVAYLAKVENLKQRIELQKGDIQAVNEAISKLSK